VAYLFVLIMFLAGSVIETSVCRRLHGPQPIPTTSALWFGKFPHNIALLVSMGLIWVLAGVGMTEGEIVIALGGLVAGFYVWRIALAHRRSSARNSVS